jgi:ABC-type lipoprotein release transport system permease subunit
VIVNQSLVERFWPHQDPLGKRLKRLGTNDQWFTVVGVARNSRHSQMNEAPQPMIYLPLAQDFYHDATIHLRVSGDPHSYVAALTEACRELDPRLPLFEIKTLRQSTDSANVVARITGRFVSIFGALALTMAAVGVFGVVACSTRQRTREVGVRMALGARPLDVCRLVLGQGLRLALVGLAVGAAVALTLTRVVEGFLYGVSPWNLAIHGGAAVILLAVALMAVYVPARRAAKVDPMVALRCE